jgi:hypothetical protein
MLNEMLNTYGFLAQADDITIFVESCFYINGRSSLKSDWINGLCLLMDFKLSHI